MLTLCDTCAIKNGSKQLSFDVDGRSYLGRGGRPERLPSSLCWAHLAFHSRSQVCDSAVLCTSVYCNCFNPSLLPEYHLRRVNRHGDKETVIDKSERGDKREAANTAAAVSFFFSVSPSIRFLLCNVRADADCLGYRFSERAERGEAPLGGWCCWCWGGVNSWPSVGRLKNLIPLVLKSPPQSSA